jgi:hypothetical protein
MGRFLDTSRIFKEVLGFDPTQLLVPSSSSSRWSPPASYLCWLRRGHLPTTGRETGSGSSPG